MTKKPHIKKGNTEKVDKIDKENQIKYPSHKESLSWEAPEFYFYPKNRYWIFGIAILLLGLSFLFIAGAAYFHYTLEIGDYLLIIGLIGVIAIFGQYGHVEPKIYSVELTQSGVEIMGEFYPYDSLKSFWIIGTPKPMIYFEKLRFGLPVSVLLEDSQVDEARDYLVRYLPEHPTAIEHLTDRLNHFLRF